MEYLKYNKAELISMFLGTVVWTSLATFMLVAKNAIGVNSIPLFETLIFIAGLTGIWIAYSRKDWKYKNWILIDITTETIFLIVLMYMLYFKTLAEAGLAVYGIIIISAVIRRVKAVASRDIEDYVLKHQHYKTYMRKLRNREDVLGYIGGAIGTGIALLFITYLKVDIIVFTKVMIILNVVQNVYDYYIWNKYLNK